MAEEKDPKDLNTDEIEEIAQQAPEPSEYPEGQAEEFRAEQPPENGLEEAAVEGLEASAERADSPVVKGFAEGVTAIQEGIENLGAPPESIPAYMEEHHDDTTTLFGRTYDIPIYTAVFMALGVLTIIEVLTAELFADIEAIKIPVLLGIALAKALLVVIFYMHLNTDSRVFALTLALPLGVALLSALFLLAVPRAY